MVLVLNLPDTLVQPGGDAFGSVFHYPDPPCIKTNQMVVQVKPDMAIYKHENARYVIAGHYGDITDIQTAAGQVHGIAWVPAIIPAPPRQP